MQSGECVDGLSPTLAEQEASGAAFAGKVAGDKSGGAIGKLRAMPADELVRVAHETGGVDWNPIVDGRVLPSSRLRSFGGGSRRRFR